MLILTSGMTSIQGVGLLLVAWSPIAWHELFLPWRPCGNLASFRKFKGQFTPAVKERLRKQYGDQLAEIMNETLQG